MFDWCQNFALDSVVVKHFFILHGGFLTIASSETFVWISSNGFRGVSVTDKRTDRHMDRLTGMISISPLHVLFLKKTYGDN